MDNLVVENIVNKSFKTMLKTLEKCVDVYKKILFIVYKLSFHQLFPNFSTYFYTTNHSLLFTNCFHYSTYPTTITTKYINIEERK